MLAIYTNNFSITAQKNLNGNRGMLQTSIERLSSGLRINHASDDAAGLAIATGMNAQLKSMGQASRNANDGVSMLNTAEGAMNQQVNILTRMRELASQSANGTVTDTQRSSIQTEFGALQSEIDRIANVTTFNGVSLLASGNGAFVGSGITNLQIGAGATTSDSLNLNTAVGASALVGFNGFTTSGLQVGTSSVTVSGLAWAQTALGAIDSALNVLNQARGGIGAVTNRLGYTLSNLATSNQNINAAQSQIMDADYATEVSSFTRNQILVQASTAILAQANQVPQTVLQLLG
ncbi:MAG: flagellin FliC [Nitrospinae bacterium]|nr:flagellin FliC [Nitrospinota bacterium]